MKKNTFPLQPENFYHIYNRGINGGPLFFNEQNYFYLLKLLTQKVKPVADIYSYCFLQNHFHLLVKIKSEILIREKFIEKEKVNIEKRIGQQFSNSFNSYSQAINKHFGRTGKLFELPFRRKEIKTDQQLLKSILYINKNPVKHKITDDLFSYQHSSINKILNNENYLVESKEVLSLFKGAENFKIALKNFPI